MAQLNEQFLRMQKLAGVITESQYNKKMQMLNEEITVGETYTASMPTSSDGKERMDIKVKVLGVDRNDNNRFIVTPLEDKDYTNPVSKQLNSFEKGKQYGVEAEFIKESLNKQLNEEKIPFFHLDQILNLADLSKPKADQMADLKVGLIVLPKKYYKNEGDIKQSVGKVAKIEGDKVTVEKVNGDLENRAVSDLVHLIDGGYRF